VKESIEVVRTHKDALRGGHTKMRENTALAEGVDGGGAEVQRLCDLADGEEASGKKRVRNAGRFVGALADFDGLRRGGRSNLDDW
jgi:hypothetical protein